MRVIQTSDIHLDRTYAALELPPSQGTKCRRHLFETLQAILGRASDWPADALVICGDLFEHDRVTRATLKELREALAAVAPVRVFICAGREDACGPGSPYVTEQWPDNVHCFGKPAWEAVELDDIPLTIHGFGWDRADYAGGLPAGLTIKRDGRTHMAFGYGLAGSVLHGQRSEPARFDDSVSLPDGLDYFGLGELHTARAIHGGFDTPVWYAGAPAGHDFDDSGPHQYLEIEVGAAGEAPQVSPRTGADPFFGSATLDCSALDTGQALIDGALEAMAEKESVQVLRLTLEGEIPRQVYDEMEGVRETLSDIVRHLQWRDNCQLAEDYDAIGREHTSLGALIGRINREIADAPNHTVRVERARSRDLGLSAFRNTALPIRGLVGEQR